MQTHRAAAVACGRRFLGLDDFDGLGPVGAVLAPVRGISGGRANEIAVSAGAVRRLPLASVPGLVRLAGSGRGAAALGAASAASASATVAIFAGANGIARGGVGLAMAAKFVEFLEFELAEHFDACFAGELQFASRIGVHHLILQPRFEERSDGFDSSGELSCQD